MNSKSKWWENCSWDDSDGPKPINPTEYQIFVGGLNSDVDDKCLRCIFQETVGAVWDAIVFRFRDGRSRGFGLVQFVSKDSVTRAMHIGEVKVGNTIVKLRQAVEKKDATSYAKLSFKKKVVLFGITEIIQRSHLEEYFKAFGEIEHSQMFQETPEDKNIGSGFIQFTE